MHYTLMTSLDSSVIVEASGLAIHAQIVQQMLLEHSALLLGQQLSCHRVHQIEGKGKAAEGGPHAQGQPAQQTRTQAAVQLAQQKETHAESSQGARHVSDVGDGYGRSSWRGLQVQQGSQLAAVQSVAQIAGN